MYNLLCVKIYFKRTLLLLLLCLLPGSIADLRAELRGDEEVPEVFLDVPVFSPNSDGVQDEARIMLRQVPPGMERPADWSLRILDGSENPVREIRADFRWTLPLEETWELFESPLQPAQQGVFLFKTQVWDGRAANGEIVPDGTYTIELHITDRASGRIFKTVPVAIAVDTIAPTVRVSSRQSVIFRPLPKEKAEDLSQPGETDTQEPPITRIVLQQRADIEPGAVYTGRILDATGQELERRVWKGNLPQTVRWDGNKANGEPLDYGTYVYELMVRDAAGNRSLAEFPDLVVSALSVQLDLRTARYAFSPDGNGLQDVMELDVVWLVVFDAAATEQSWEFLVRNPAGEVIFAKRGAGVLPETLSWNGRDGENRLLAEGEYRVELAARSAGRSLRSASKSVWLDLSPPQAQIITPPYRLSPDRDGLDESVDIELETIDESGVAQWSLSVFYQMPQGFEPPRKLHRVFRGRGPHPEKIRWSGPGTAGETPESFERFVLELEVLDRAGNRSRIATGLPVDILFRPITTGNTNLEARIPIRKTYFDVNGHLLPGGREVLDRVIAKLRRYPGYGVEIESHSALAGREEENLRKTEERAFAVYSFLQSAGTLIQLLGYRGLGETELLAPETSTFSRYRNERVLLKLLLQPQQGR